MLNSSFINYKLENLSPYTQADLREISKFWFSSLNSNFLRVNPENDYHGEFPDFYEFTQDMNFAIFLKMVIPMMAIYVKKFSNHFQGEFGKIRKFILVIIFATFP